MLMLKALYSMGFILFPQNENAQSLMFPLSSMCILKIYADDFICRECWCSIHLAVLIVNAWGLMLMHHISISSVLKIIRKNFQLSQMLHRDDASNLDNMQCWKQRWWLMPPTMLNVNTRSSTLMHVVNNWC